MTRSNVKSAVKTLIAFAVAAVYLAPILWLLMCSFKQNEEIFDLPPKYLFSPTIDNYSAVLGDGQYLKALLNSTIAAAVVAAITVVLGSMAAYALVRGSLRRTDSVKFFAISTRMGLPLGLLISYFLIFKHLDMLGSRLSLIIVYTNMNLGFAIWMMLGFFESIPKSIEEAALVDGCGRVSAFLRVAIPLVRPGLAATAIFTFIMCWNEFPYAMILSDLRNLTVPVIIPNYLGVIRLEWGHLSAAGMLTAAPVMIFAMVIQKHFVKGLTFGAVD